MRKRTRSREFALQVLYQVDITSEDAAPSLKKFWEAHCEEEVEDEIKSFTEELVKGTLEHLAEIDKNLSQHATNWQLKRMATVDRNIMRMSCFELLLREDIPKVSINEAVELAKKYSGLEAGKFVNAILDKIRLEQKK